MLRILPALALATVLLASCDDGAMAPAAVPPSSAPTGRDDAVEAAALDLLGKAVQNALDGVGTDGDPYGVSVDVKVSIRTASTDTTEGAVYGALDQNAVVNLLDKLLHNGERFDVFGLSQTRTYSTAVAGRVFYVTGIVPGAAGDLATHQVVGGTRHAKQSTGGEFRETVVTVSVVIAHATPDKGEIEGDIQYIDKSGSPQDWDPAQFDGLYPELRYRRLGPGKDERNSGKGKYADRWIRTGQMGHGEFVYGDESRPVTPGHYYPSVRLDGCDEQVWEDPVADKAEYEQIVGLERKPTWAEWQAIDQGFVVRAEKRRDVKIVTRFSTGNRIEGTIADDAGQAVTGSRNVNLVRLDTADSSAQPPKPRTVVSSGGSYSIDDVESGLYAVWVEGEEPVQASVCNKPAEGPNHTYVVPLKSTSGYLWNISADYTASAGGKTVLKVSADWNSVPLVVHRNGGEVPGGLNESAAEAIKAKVLNAHPNWKFNSEMILPEEGGIEGGLPATKASVAVNTIDLLDLDKQRLSFVWNSNAGGYRIDGTASGEGDAFENSCVAQVDAECKTMLSSILSRSTFTISGSKSDDESGYEWKYTFTPIAGSAF